jgi:hypothetical protein
LRVEQATNRTEHLTDKFFRLRCGRQNIQAISQCFNLTASHLFGSAQRLFGALSLGNIHDRSDKLELTRVISFSMGNNAKVFDRAVIHQYSMFEIKILPILQRASDGRLHEGDIVRMNTLKNEFESRFRRPVDLEDAKSFLRPDDLTR